MQTIPLDQKRPRKPEPLTFAAEQLQAALDAQAEGREAEWARRVRDALAQVEAALRQHRANAKAPDGLFSEVDENRPTLAKQADELRNDHDEFLKQVRALRDESQQLAGPPAPSLQPADDRDALRQLAEKFLNDLRQTKEAELKLVLDSVNTDLGGGD